MQSTHNKRTSRLSVIISAVLHAGVLLALFVFAAREGMLGKQLKKISVTIVPKEKPPERPKEKPAEPKPLPEVAKTEPVKPIDAPSSPEAPKPAELRASTSIPVAAPSVAPPAAEMPSFNFEGGKPVESSSDPDVLYKTYVEYMLRAHWNRPEGVIDNTYNAEVEVSISPDGRIQRTDWRKGSGDNAWDDSVRRVLAETRSLGRLPPKGFPGTVLVRFDVLPTADVSLR